MTGPTMTREQAGAAVKAAVAERDAIQANLLELDSSFGKQLLAGAELTGETRRRWDATAATLAALWQVYEAYSAVTDQAAEAVTRHLGQRELAALTSLLTGRSVQLASGPAPLAGRDLADPGREDMTLATALARMRGAFSAVTEVTAAAEHVWTEVAGRLDSAGAELARVAPLAATLGDEALAANLAAAQGELARMRDTLNSDPLALWQGGAVDTSGADQLAERIAAVTARADELIRLRDESSQRVGEVRTAATAARTARDDAVAAWQRAAEKIAASALPPPPAERGRRVRAAGRPGAAAGRRPVAAPRVRAGPARPRAGHRDGALQGGRTSCRIRPGQARRTAGAARRLQGQGRPARRDRGRRPGRTIRPCPRPALDRPV